MNEMEELIAEKIRSAGPLCFCEFMDLALYHPVFGYYSTHARIGKSGADFYTNADVHQLFGSVLADVMAAYLGRLSSGGQNSIVEFGAGTGRLAFDILTTIEESYPNLAKSIKYIIVEQSPRLRQQQHETLIGFPQVCWMNIDDLIDKSITGIVFSNELIDAFPVHRVRFDGNELQEQFVGTEEDG